MSCYLPSKVQLCKDAEIKLHIHSEFFTNIKLIK